MKRCIAIVGTSHVSALARAWKEISADWPELAITYFAAPGWNFRRLQLDEDKRFGVLDKTQFEPAEIRLFRTSFGFENIALGDFDAVVHVGRDIYETDLVSLLANFSIDERRPQAGLPEMSSAAYKGFITALANQAVLPKLWHYWENPTLFVLPTPRYAEGCAGAQGIIYRDWAILLDQLDAGILFAHLLSEYYEYVRKHFAEVGITLLLPPPTVLGDSGLTKAHFTRDARQLTNARYSEIDHKHMNLEYGRIVLTHVLQHIAPSIINDSSSKNSG